MKNKINAPVVVGIIGHSDIDLLPEIKHTLENLNGFKIIYFKTSSEKLFILEAGRRK